MEYVGVKEGKGWWDNIDILRRVIRCHAYLYYTLAEPLISDATYDKLYTRLKELETNDPSLITSDSPTQLVGEGISLMRWSGKTKEEVTKMLNDIGNAL